MLIDARSLPNGHEIDADVCVIGAGPAGLTLAREFASSGLEIVILESGGDGSDPTADAAAQELSHGETTGDVYSTLREIRRRGLGGTAALWSYPVPLGFQDGLRCCRLDAIDFEKRDWIDHSGWPFGLSELAPFYERAETALGLGTFEPAARETPDGRAPAGFPLAIGQLESSEFRFVSGARFLAEHTSVVRRARTVTTYLHATVTELDCAENPSVISRVRAQTAPGRGFTVAAKRFVLASGGIENTRLLLLATQTHPHGLGNRHGLVGKYYMDHPHVYGGHLKLRDVGILGDMLRYEAQLRGDVGHMWKITLREETLRRERLLHSWTAIYPRPSARYRAARESAKLALQTVRFGRQDRLPDLHDIGNVVRGLGHFIPATINKRINGRPLTLRDTLPPWARASPHLLIDGFELTHAVEQSPDISTLTLGSGRDPFGKAVAHLHYRWSDLDIDSVRRTNAIVGKELSAAGIGELEIEPGRDVPDRTEASTPHHPTGTTRMHRDPRQGVVNENGRLHDVENLYITGSSVFPTSGHANPTLTVVALSIRLADHLKAGLHAQGSSGARTPPSVGAGPRALSS